jgi:hypothetical protein
MEELAAGRDAAVQRAVADREGEIKQLRETAAALREALEGKGG